MDVEEDIIIQVLALVSYLFKYDLLPLVFVAISYMKKVLISIQIFIKSKL